MQNFKYVFFILSFAILSSFFVSCEKEPEETEPKPPIQQAQISVEVYFNDLPQFPENDELLEGVNVWLYDELEYQVLRLNHIRMGTTDSLGSVFLGSHDVGTYYITAEHPSYGIQEETISIASSTHSFVSIRYPF